MLISFVLLISCSNEGLKVVTLSSTLPEIVPFVEDFNKNNNKIKIVLKIGLTETNSDLFIFRGQADNSPYVPENITHLFNKNIKKDSFYTDILSSVIDNKGNIFLLPLTYDLPGIIYNKENIRHTMNIDIEEFISNKNMIFSPFWDNNFILLYYLTSLPNFSLQDSYLDSEELINTANNINSLLSKRDDKWNETLFNKKYLHLSPELLIKQSIIDYYFYYLSDYIALYPSSSDQISFSALSRNSLITAIDDITFVGINRNSKNKKASEEVLTWMFQDKNQSEFIKNNFNESGLYKLFNGELSTLITVTKKTLPTYYPRLNGLILNEEMITVPSNLPKLWDSLKLEAFMPIFRDIKTLPEESWTKKYLEYYNDWSKKHNK